MTPEEVLTMTAFEAGARPRMHPWAPTMHSCSAAVEDTDSCLGNDGLALRCVVLGWIVLRCVANQWVCCGDF
jgi:hypothetical protein